VAVDTDGAPQLTRDGRPGQFSVSIAHCDQWLAVALASGATVGIDIQTQRNRTRYREMAELIALGEDAVLSPDQFNAHWVLREAISKASSGSVLDSHSIEAELRPACETDQQVDVGNLTASVQRLLPGVHVAIVMDQTGELRQCA
jgi:phosphopantetheinyl transferase